MRVTAGQREQIRAALLRAGLRLFARQGFTGTTVNEIAMAAGVAKGTFYNYFPTKEDLALAAFVAALGEVEAGMAAVLGHQTVEERLSALFAHFDQWAVHPELIWIWSLQNLRRGGSETASAQLRRLLTVVFADAQGRGEVRTDRPAPILALDLEGVVLVHIAAWYHGGARHDLLADLRAAADAYVAGARAVGHAGDGA